MSIETSPYVHRVQRPPRLLLVGQVFYDRRSRRALDPLFCPLHNERLGPFFEADVVRDAVQGGWHAGADLVGVFSWRFGRKIPLTGADVVSLVDAAPRGDVYSFFGALAPGPIWRIADAKHPGIRAAADALFARLGLGVDAASLHAPPIYQHHFIASANVYEAFVGELLSPALEAMGDRDDGRLQDLLYRDSTYRDPRHRRELLERVYGVPYLPLHPFVAERLFSTWLALRDEVTVHPLWRGRFVEAGDVGHEPELSEVEP